MKRKEGFIDLDKVLEYKNIDTKSIETVLKSPDISSIKGSSKAISFELFDEIYYFKFYKSISPYNEIVAKELANDFGLPAVKYDLAILGNEKGVLSQNFRKKNAKYISGFDLLNNFGYIGFGDDHNLENIWDSLEYRYKNSPNKNEIVKKLMNKIVNIFIFDIIICHYDRHSLNWEIEESENSIDIAPIYDNERLLMTKGDKAWVSLTVDGEDSNLKKNLQFFKSISEESFTNLIKDKMWIIGEENLNNIFKRIEDKTNYPMPLELKEYYLEEYKNHKTLLENILGNDENIRKR